MTTWPRASRATPARSGAEPARYLVLTEARVPAAGRLLILFTELFLEMLSLAAVALGLAIGFRGTGGALAGLEGLVGGYAVFVLGSGGVGLVLALLHFVNTIRFAGGAEVPVISRIEASAQDWALTRLRGPRPPSGAAPRGCGRLAQR